MAPSPLIEDYAMIGDCETAALVSRNGSIDWLCWPRFDSGACFAALLGTPEHGRWRIGPVADRIRTRRRYRGETLVLETEHETADGTVVVTDFMPPRDGTSELVRMVRGTRGTVTLESELVLRFDYGSVVPWVSQLEDGTLRAVAGPDMVTLRSDVPSHGEHQTTVASFTVTAGQQHIFVLTWSPSHLPVPAPIDASAALASTLDSWQEWSARCRYEGPWRAAVVRSLLTLKALTYAPTGGIVAAPTTSLPEEIGGVRNWDYRYCWLRDATLTLLAFIDAGYTEEAGAWRDWLLRAAAGSPDQVQIMYGLGGERLLQEWEVPWLPGYEGSRPVRIGNAAHAQMQLDVYGEVMDALHQARLAGLGESAEAWSLQVALTNHLCGIWREPDSGIWEVRGPAQHFTHSKVMAWVALDRTVKSAEQFGLDGPVDKWRAERQAVHDEVCARAFDADRDSFMQAYGSTELDASLLMLPLVGFLPGDDPRVLGTVRCIESELMADGFVLRYDSRETKDGLPAGEGAFLACSFWLVDNYLLQGRTEDARAMFERLISLCNDVGLLAEEYDARLGRQVGNFPQAFSHVALVSTAFNFGGGAASVPGDGRPMVQRGSGPAQAIE